MKSSYIESDIKYGDVIELITFMIQPEIIVEFGILEGYSLTHFAKSAPHAKIFAYDIFEKFNGNCANISVQEEFRNNSNVTIEEGDFYQKHTQFQNDSIDILHIDIANDGYTYEYAIENYWKCIKKGGCMILEGGSLERDNVYWMKQYHKKPICDIIYNLSSSYKIHTIEKFPSMTIIYKK